MKLSFFTTQNTAVGGRKGKPSITIRENGQISFSQTLIDELGLIGKKVAFAQNSERKQDWYLVINHPDGFVLNEKKGKNSATFSSVKIVGELFKSISTEAGTTRIPVAMMATEENVYAMLTAGAEVVQREKKFKRA